MKIRSENDLLYKYPPYYRGSFIWKKPDWPQKNHEKSFGGEKVEIIFFFWKKYFFHNFFQISNFGHFCRVAPKQSIWGIYEGLQCRLESFLATIGCHVARVLGGNILTAFCPVAIVWWCSAAYAQAFFIPKNRPFCMILTQNHAIYDP